MKNLYIAFALFISGTAFGQIEQDVNKTSGTESNAINDIDSIRFNAGQTEMQIILNNGTVVNHAILDINNVTFSGQLVGEVTSLDCAAANITGTLVEGVAASGVSAEISYTGGNGGPHNGQTVTSTGVTGLTATLTAGNFANGAGTLTYTITGTPNTSGTASFAIQIGGISCTLEITVGGGVISTLDCAAATITGTLVEGVAASGVSAEISYTGGNGGPHNGQTVTSTGVTGLTATLTAGNFANGAGTLTYTITGTPNTSGTASFAIQIGGISCTLEITVPNCIPVIGIRVGIGMYAQDNNGFNDLNFTFNEPVTSSVDVNCDPVFTCVGTGTNMRVNANGFALSANGMQRDFFFDNIPSSVDISMIGEGVHSYLPQFTWILSDGSFLASGQSCTNSDPFYYTTWNVNYSCTFDDVCEGVVGEITSLDCAGATNNGTLIAGVAASGVNSVIPYTGGNGGTHSGQTVTSTGITGLTATLAAGSFANGNGSLTYTITGLTTCSGTASFALNIGGQNCTLNLIVSANTLPPVYCSGSPTPVIEVTSATGRIWMDRNLGASQVATSITDNAAYGDLYQWGRGTDGHQCRNSATTSTLSCSDQPVNGNFILAPNSPNDWRNPQNTNLWQGVNGINNPCPTGFRIPTEAEFTAEYLSWTIGQGPFNSPLKLTMGGGRTSSNGNFQAVDGNGYYWTSTIDNSFGLNLPRYFGFYTTTTGSMNSSQQAFGLSVRCIKD